MTAYKVPVSYDIEIEVREDGTYRAEGYLPISVDTARLSASDGNCRPHNWRAICQAIVDLHERLTRELWKDAKPGEHYMIGLDGGEPVEFVAVAGVEGTLFRAIQTYSIFCPWEREDHAASIISCVKVER